MFCLIVLTLLLFLLFLSSFLFPFLVIVFICLGLFFLKGQIKKKKDILDLPPM